MRYFAYGSNLNKEQMQCRCPSSKLLEVNTLEGYKLVFKLYADIIPAEGKSVIGGLWEISIKDEKRLDKYEGYPYSYEKFYVEDIMFYRMTDGVRESELPKTDYLERILQGFKDFGLPPYETLNHNLGNPPIQNTPINGDLSEKAKLLIADSL